MAHPASIRTVTLAVGFALGWMLLVAGVASAAPVAPRPCSTGPAAPAPAWDGELALGESKAGRKMLKRAGVKRKLTGAARLRLGDPTFPVRKARLGAVSKIWLKGGINFRRGKRLVKVRDLIVTVPKQPGRLARVTARIGKRQVVLYRVNAGKRVVDSGGGVLDLLGGKVRFGANAVKEINRRLGLKKRRPARRLRAGVNLGKTWMSVTWSGEASDDPMGEAPPEPAVLTEPAGTVPLSGAPAGEVSIRWELRDTWVNYISGVEAPVVGDGATKGEPREDGYVYDYNFRFKSGWTLTAPAEDDEVNTFIQGEGGVGFRLCAHGINFTAANPEIELGDNTNSRIIFKVNGIENTPFPDQRAVMIKLLPSLVTPVSETNGEGVTAVKWEKIPGFIPAEGTGIFADFYAAYDASFDDPASGYDLANRPDRFGFLSVTYTYGSGEGEGEEP